MVPLIALLKPTLTYFECLELNGLDQNPDGMLEAIIRSIENNNLSDLWKKIIYLSADGALVNSGKENEWILFVWCSSHRLELAMKDALADFTNPVSNEFILPAPQIVQKTT